MSCRARDEMDSKVDMLLSGADDYVVKPFEIREVLARVQVQLRKRTGQEEKKVLEHNGLLLDTEEHQIYVDGVRLEGITRQEFLILQLFLRWPKKVFSKEEILRRHGKSRLWVRRRQSTSILVIFVRK